MRNQLALAYEGNPDYIDERLDTSKPINEILKQAQKAFNAWSKLKPEQRTTTTLLKMLNFDFFEVLDSLTIARSRRHIEKYYSTTEIGKFPDRLKPIARRPHLTDLDNAINYNDIYTILSELNLTVYTPSHFILPSKMSKYMDVDDEENINLTMQGREQGIRRLMAINLLKRLENSVFSFRLTLDRIRLLFDETIHAIEQ